MGRPKRDFDKLFNEFATTPLSRTEFLRQKGINPFCGSACRNTAGWEKRRVELHQKVIPLGKNYQPANPISQDTLADSNEAALAERLVKKIEATLVTNADNLSIENISRLTSALSQLQLIRARAAGIWGNTTVRSTRASPIAEESIEPRRIPVYAVEMNENGKFKYARPRLVDYYDAPPHSKDQVDECDYYIVETFNAQTQKYEVARRRHEILREKGAAVP